MWFDRNLTSAYSAADGPVIRASSEYVAAEPATNVKLSAAPCLNELEMTNVEMGNMLGVNKADVA